MISDGVRIAVGLCKRFEGFRPQPYLCPAGVPTLGYGSTRRPDGSCVRLDDPAITEAEAERWLLLDLYRNRLRSVQRLCPGIDTAGRLGAILDFCYNMGAGALAASTLRTRINAGDWDDVPHQLMRWRFAAGRELRGLVLRRRAEADLIQP